jgi:hypothetical protein
MMTNYDDRLCLDADPQSQTGYDIYISYMMNRTSTLSPITLMMTNYDDRLCLDADPQSQAGYPH